jgi:hypothetical protein
MTQETEVGGLLTEIDADGNKLESTKGQLAEGSIGAVVEPVFDGSPIGRFVAVPVTRTESRPSMNGNLGTYDTFEEARDALVSDHREPWTREERRQRGGW